MAGARSRRGGGRPEYWPAFVDVLTNLLLVFIFLLSVFALVQFLLSQEISGRDTVLTRLNAQIAELTELLALERASKGEITDNVSTLQASLAAAESERDRLRGMLDSQSDAASSASDRVTALVTDLDNEKQVSQRALAQVELLNQQISALRRQIAALEDALNVSDTRDKESQTKIADLGRRLNVALAQAVQELSRYRSDFFGRLREILGDRPDIRIVGDRFVFQSEVLFATGSDEVNEQGPGRARQARRRGPRTGKGDPAGDSVGAPGQRTHRQAADHQHRRAFPLQLGSFGGPRHFGRPLPDGQGYSGRTSGRCRFRRIPADRGRRDRGGLSPRTGGSS